MRWINVNEWLPQPYEDVLAYIEYKGDEKGEIIYRILTCYFAEGFWCILDSLNPFGIELNFESNLKESAITELKGKVLRWTLLPPEPNL